MQKKLVGFVTQRIFEAQDFLGLIGNPNESGVVTEKAKRSIVRINNAMIPWFQVLSKIAVHAQLNKLATMWNSGAPSASDTKENIVVYARVAINAPGAMYIGETGAWENRIKQHYMATLKHSDRCGNKCRGCREHVKYLRHRAAPAHMWAMIPIQYCETKYEAKRLERACIKLWKPCHRGHLPGDHACYEW